MDRNRENNELFMKYLEVIMRMRSDRNVDLEIAVPMLLNVSHSMAIEQHQIRLNTINLMKSVFNCKGEEEEQVKHFNSVT